jgi:hypothetical protein
MSERHEAAVISPHPDSRLAAYRPHAPNILVDSPFPRLCVQSGHRASRCAGRERRLLLRLNMHGAYAGITPGHTDHSQPGVWLAVGYAHVFCILQRRGVARRVAASCAVWLVGLDRLCCARIVVGRWADWLTACIAEAVKRIHVSASLVGDNSCDVVAN